MPCVATIYIQTEERSGKGNNQNVPEQLDLESSFTLKIYSDYACLKVGMETLRTIDRFLEQSRSVQSIYSTYSLQQSRCHMACCWLRRIVVYLHCCFSASLSRQCVPRFELIGASFQFSCLLEPCETAHLLDWLTCLAQPRLASCQSTLPFCFECIVERIGGILHGTEVGFDLFHLLSTLHGRQVRQGLGWPQWVYVLHPE